MELLESADEQTLQRKSSIYQFGGFLAVRRGDEWVPIQYDVLDAVRCNKVEAHKAVLTNKPYIGYVFPVKECRYISDAYVLGEEKGVELLPLPEFCGAGFYENAYDRAYFVNAGNGALGMRNDTTLRVGLDYVVADDELEPVD